jgi:hypothetical protein
MGNTAEHCKPGGLSNVERVAHPREKVCEAIMSTFYTLGYPGTPTRKG